ncbi:MAG: TetR/AcrR family transcriptional regulator, partial [Actinomycetota bacterium]
ATRSRLLAATSAIIVEQGWGGVSTRRIADRAGVNPGVVHYHFGSVEELKREASLDAFRAMIEPFLAAAEDWSARQLVEEVARVSVEEYAPGTAEATLIYEALPAAARDPELQAGLRDLLTRFRQAVAEAIRRWHPTPTVEPEVLAELLSAAIDGLQLHLLAEPDLDLPRHLAPVLDLLGPEVEP